MKKKPTFILSIAVMLLCFAGYSNATVVGTIEYSRAGSGLGEFSEMNFSICYPLPGDYDSISFSWNVTTDDIGETFFASMDTHQNFDNFIYLLTNGVNNLLFLVDIGSLMTSNDWLGAEWESVLISGIQEGVDFKGYDIDSIGLTVNELFLDYDADAIKGGLTNFSYDITYTINGEAVPEPLTVILLGLGGLLIRKKRKTTDSV